MKLTIGHLYPDLLNLYGDRGNIQCFRKRLEWRGIEAEVIPFLSGDKIDFSKLDIVLLGGGSDREQELVCGYLKEIKADFKNYVEQGGVVLAVCGGYQLLGKYYTAPNGEKIQGLGILDIYTEAGNTRFIGDTIIYNEDFNETYVGFENHSGRTYLNGLKPLGKCIHGYGNNGSDGYEGCIYKNTYCTYFHGSLLAKNPELADRFIKTALEIKYSEVALEKLDDSLELKAKEVMINRLNNNKK